MADVNLRIETDWQSRAVLAALGGAFEMLDDADQLRIRAFQVINGRENHAALVMERGLGGPCRLVSFGECRNSDSIMVWVETLERAPFNQPTVRDLSDDGYATRRSFRYGDVVGAAECIVRVARELLEAPGDG